MIGIVFVVLAAVFLIAAWALGIFSEPDPLGLKSLK